MKQEEMIQKIMKETGKPKAMAAAMAGRIKDIRPELQPCIAAWINGNVLEFSFQGITMEEIQKKENCSYIEAVFSMQVLLKHPERAEKYKTFRFRRK